MKTLFTLITLVSLTFSISAQTGSTLPSLHNFRCVTLNGDTVSLSQYYGKKLMIVNVASYCTYTPQYRPLQQLYDNYNQNNFEILGFPSDDFGSQGGTDSAISQTCSGYNVTFLIMQKIACTSADTAPVYKWLQRQDLNGVENSHVSWNFNKYLIDEAGHYVRHFESTTAPDDTAIINWILSPSVVPDTIDSTHTGIITIGTDKLVHMTSANPINTSIDIAMNLPSAQMIDVTMYGMDGKLAVHIFNGIASETQRISYPVTNVPSGMYLLKAQTSAGQQVIKCLVQH